MRSKRKRGAPTKEAKLLDTSSLFIGVWVILGSVNRYWQIVQEDETPSPQLQSLMVKLENLLSSYPFPFLGSEMMKQRKGIDRSRLALVGKYRKRVGDLMAQAKTLGKEGLRRQFSDLLLPENLKDHASIVKRLADAPFLKGHALKRDGKSEYARYELHRVLGLPSPRSPNLKGAERSSPRPLRDDPHSLHALHSLLVVSGYPRKTANGVARLLEKSSIT